MSIINLSFLLPAIIGLVVSLFLTVIVKNLAIKHHWTIKRPTGRDIHQKPIPRTGGVVIFVSFWLIVGLFYIISPQKFHFVDEKIIGIDQNLLGVFFGSLILLVIGIIDDIKGIKPWPKLFFQFLAAFLVVLFGIKIWWFSNPLGGVNIILGNWTYVIVPLWIVLIINVVNWLDGIDGLATGISSIAFLILAILSLQPQVSQPATAQLSIILLGVCLGFLIFNFNPAKIFLGDSGSMFLGFMIAIAAVISGGKVATAILVLGIPILDALWVIARRILGGRSPMLADKLHIHHRFLEAGFNQRQTIIILYVIAASFGMIALQTGSKGKLLASLWVFAIMVIIAVGLYFLKIRRLKGSKK